MSNMTIFLAAAIVIALLEIVHGFHTLQPVSTLSRKAGSRLFPSYNTAAPLNALKDDDIADLRDTLLKYFEAFEASFNSLKRNVAQVREHTVEVRECKHSAFGKDVEHEDDGELWLQHDGPLLIHCGDSVLSIIRPDSGNLRLECQDNERYLLADNLMSLGERSKVYGSVLKCRLLLKSPQSSLRYCRAYYWI